MPGRPSKKIKCLAPTKKGTPCQASKLHCEYHREYHAAAKAKEAGGAEEVPGRVEAALLRPLR
jgi:hypothetical protein